MIIDWDVEEIIEEINRIARAENCAYETGYNTVKCKHDLYHVLWHVEDCLANCSTYVGEDEWIRQREKQKTYKALKGD